MAKSKKATKFSSNDWLADDTTGPIIVGLLTVPSGIVLIAFLISVANLYTGWF